MSDLIKDLKYFWSQRVFAVGLIATMVLSYATLLFNPTVGVDDTSFKLYYIDGVSPAMGRWCLFMIHKIFPLDYNPYFVETIGLLFFCLSVSLWCVVFYRQLGKRVPTIVYTIFAGLMISSPILSEVVIWYVQDGIYLGYGMTALAVLVTMKALELHRDHKKELKKWSGRVLGLTLLAAVLLAVALGFYEAFMIVYLMAIVMNFLLVRVSEQEKYSTNPIRWFLNLFLLGILAMVCRSLFINGITKVFHLESQALVLESRGFGDIVSLFGGWFDGSRDAGEFALVFKEFLVKYTIHGIVYVPIRILVVAEMIVVGIGILWAARKKDIWVLLSVIACLCLPLVMPLLEGTATYYRSSEYVPLMTAFAALMVGVEVYRQNRAQWIKGIALFIAFFMLYQQGYEMNKWLLVDANKYEDDKRTMDAIALELMRDYDFDDTPICVIGNRETPYALIEKVYTPEYSKKYTLVKKLVCAIDPRIFDKYNTEYGYAVAESPQLSYINWASQAYYGFDRELIKFWKMHGYTFLEDGNLDHYKAARKLMKDAPVWPAKGSVVDMYDYIIVNFGNY